MKVRAFIPFDLWLADAMHYTSISAASSQLIFLAYHRKMISFLSSLPLLQAPDTITSFSPKLLSQ